MKTSGGPSTPASFILCFRSSEFINAFVFAVADVAKAKAFMNSDDLKHRMNEAGVEGPPDVFMYKIAQRY